MRRILAGLLGLLGLWYLAAGVVSQFQAGDSPVPPSNTMLVLGVVLLVAAVLCWRGRKPPLAAN
jgi:hypothetical protein